MKKKIIISVIMLALISAIVILTLQVLKLNLELKSKDEYTENKSPIAVSGGLIITFEADESSFPKGKNSVTEDDMNAVERVFTTRLNQLGYTEARISRGDLGQITVEIPEETDTEKAAELLGSAAVLEFKNDAGEVVLTGNDVKDAKYQYGQISETTAAQSYVELTLKSDAVEKWANATGNAVGSYISICVDGVEISRPSVSQRIDSNKCTITGGFTVDSAKTLANQIKSGALPFSLMVTSISTLSVPNNK